MNFVANYEQVESQLLDHPWPALQAAVPFALAQAWEIPCAYERSVKLSADVLLANRYLLSFATSDITLQHVAFACEKLHMPASVFKSIKQRLSRASRFMIGFEDSGGAVVFKVYLELLRHNRELARSHIGWKQRVSGQTDTDPTATCRLAFYRPLRRASLAAQLEIVTRAIDSERPSSTLLREVIQLTRNANKGIVCLQVSESTGRRSLDWNVYSAELRIGAFAASITTVAEQYRLERQQIERWIGLCQAETLGHIASGFDARGGDFLTLYYSAQHSG